MARQDQTIKYSVEIDGDAGLRKIADGLDAISKSSSEAAPEATALLEQLKSLAAQNSLVSGLVADKAALVDLGNELFAAKEKAAALQAQFTATATPTAALSRSLEKANASVASLESQYNGLTLAIVKGQNALAAAGVDANNLDTAQRGLQSSIAGVRDASAGLATGFNAAAAAGEREALSLTEIAERSVVLRKAFDELKVLLGTFAGFIALEKAKEEITDIIDTGDKFEKWGIQFKNAFGGAEQGQEALAKVKEIAEQTPLSLDEVTKAALQAKKEGLDPFNGSLLGLIDATTKFGGGSDQLDALITALGKSANQGGLNIRTLTTLEQQGIPAAKLLGDAIGKTADQVRELAKNGKLGADSVAPLITALGNVGTGAITDQMELLSTQVTKAKDSYDEFLELIAKSGAYDFVRDELKSLNAAFKQGLEDGTLQQSAKAISDSLVAIGNALVGITRFAVEHGAAIKEVVEDYALFKAAMLGLDLVGYAQNFIGLAQATTAAGAAAEAASVGGFGKLGAAIGKIPKQVQVAVALVGAEFAISETLKVVDTLGKITEQTNQAAQAQRNFATDQAALAEKAKAVAAALQQSATVQLVTSENLEKQNRAQSEQYLAQLQNATKYYQALQIQAQAIGDVKGAKDAGDALKVLGVAADQAKAHLKDLADSLTISAASVGLIVDRFDQLRSNGASAIQAIEQAFANVEFATPKGLNDTLDIIRQISARAGEAQVAVRSELADALSKLNATDLGDFQKNVTDKIAAAGKASQEATIAIQASLQAAFLQLGLSAQQAQIEVTASGQKIIDTFTNIANNASATGDQIQLAFAKALSQATTAGEVDALKQKLQEAFDAGKIGADAFGVASAAAGRKLADITVEAAKAGASLDGVGKSGETAAQRISNALQDTRDKLVVQANDISRAIADALAGGDTDGAAQLTAQFKTLDAEIQSLNADLNGADLKRYSDSLKALGDQADANEKAFQRAGNAAQYAGDQTQKSASQADEALKGTGETAKELSDRIADIGTGGFPDLSQALADTRASLLGVSDAAAKLFDAKFYGDFQTAFDATGIGFAKVIGAMSQATAEVTRQIVDQRTELQNQIAVINQIGTAGTVGFGRFGDTIDAATAKMASLSADIQQGTYDAGLLGQQELAPLQAALDAAADRVKQLDDAFQSIVDRTRDALDEEKNDQDAIEARRHQQELDDLKSAAQAANQLNSAAYTQAVERENELHALKMANIKKQQDAQNASSGSGSSSNGSGSSNSDSGSGSGASSAAISGGDIHIPLDLSKATLIGSDFNKAADELTAPLAKRLASLQARSRVNILTGK